MFLRDFCIFILMGIVVGEVGIVLKDPEFKAKRADETFSGNNSSSIITSSDFGTDSSSFTWITTSSIVSITSGDDVLESTTIFTESSSIENTLTTSSETSSDESDTSTSSESDDSDSTTSTNSESSSTDPTTSDDPTSTITSSNSDSETRSLGLRITTTFQSTEGESTVIVTQTTLISTEPSSASQNRSNDNDGGGLSQNNRIVVGVVVGVGGAIIIGLIATLFFLKKRKSEMPGNSWTFWRKNEKGGNDDIFDGELGVRDRQINQGSNF